MKTFILLIIIILSAKLIHAQTGLGDCPGIFYHYDNAGNRIERLPNTCYGGGGTDGKKSAATENADSTQNLSESIYPNPTSGNLNVVFNNAINTGQLIITDDLGRQLYKATISGTSVPLNISSFAQGVYYVTIKTGGYSFQNTVVKE